MAEFVTFNLAVQGEPVRPCEVPAGTTVGDMKIIKGLDLDLEFRLHSEPIDDDFELDDYSIGCGDYLIGTKDAKGAAV